MALAQSDKIGQKKRAVAQKQMLRIKLYSSYVPSPNS